MITKSITVTWEEGEGPNGEPATLEGNPNQRLIKIAVDSPDYPDGYLFYCTDSDYQAASTVAQIWEALGKPV